MCLGISAGQQCRVTRTRDGHGLLVATVDEVGAGQEQVETAFHKLTPEADQVVGAKLVNDNDDEELGPSRKPWKPCSLGRYFALPCRSDPMRPLGSD